MITPQTTIATANAVYCPTIMVGMRIDKNGYPVGQVNSISYAQAVVDNDGKWTANGVRGSIGNIPISFDAQGNVVGLPSDLAGLASQFASIWADLASLAGAINDIRKAV
jgi:hypothetical protein